MSEINISEWTVDRIQAEQDKHMSFAVSGIIPTVNPKQIEYNLDAIDSALDVFIRKVTEDTDMYIICEIAKMYVESQRPAEWIMNKTSARGRNYTCTACEKVSRNKFHYCPNCGRRMKYGQDNIGEGN